MPASPAQAAAEPASPPRSTSREPTSRRERLAVSITGALLAALIVALHHASWRLPFLADDYVFLENARRGLVPSLVHAYTEVPTYFRPLGREIYFWVLRSCFGAHPTPFHAVNFVLLLATIALVAAIGRRLAGARAGLLAAGLYALVYPHRVQLGYVSCSQDLIATALAASAVLATLARRRFLSAALFFAGMLAKESIVTLPLVLLAWDGLGAARGQSRWRTGLARTAPMWGAAVAWVLLVPIPRMAMSLGGAQGAVPIVNAPIASGTFWTGLRLAFLTLIDLEQPWFLLRAAFHDAIVAWWIVAFAAVVAAVIVGMAPAAPERPRDHDPPRGLPALGLLWTLLGGLPLALVGSRFNAYYVSFAAVGFALLVGCLLARASWLAVGAFALATFMNLAANATGAFRIDENDHAAPTGVSIMSFGRLESDARYANGLERFLRDHPPRPGSVIYFSQPFGYNQMGTGGEYAPRVWCDDPTLSTRVLRSYRRGAETSPAMFVRYDENPPRFSAMSESLAASIVEGEDAMYRNDPAAARAELADAVALTEPGAQDALRAELLNTLGVAAERMRDSVTARRSWQEAVRLSPTNRGALINLARLHLREGNPAEAQRWIERALASHPNDPLAREYAARIERALQR